MKSQEELQDAADRAFELLERKSPHQLAVELVSMGDRVQTALDACARMQEQRDQLACQLKDATAQCAVAADLLRELREGAEIHLHNCIVCKNEQGIANWTSKLERIDAALSGKMQEQRTTTPARIGGVVFQSGIKVSSVIEAAYLAAEHHEPNPAAFQALQDAMLDAALKPEGGA